jgi:Domain of unknown function (DUF4145)
MPKEEIPQLGTESFSCPHAACGARAHQTWFKLFGYKYKGDDRPFTLTAFDLNKLRAENFDQNVVTYAERKLRKEIFFEERTEWTNVDQEVENLYLSQCYSCKGLSVWHADQLIYPKHTISIEPNEEMPPDVKADFLEANDILDKSARGAAALLRLCIQKLMVHLGEKGENINADIGSLVSKGLDKRIQKALDVVRVVGNNAVHPGQLDLQDDKSIATKLFGLVNLIVDSMIAQNKHIEALYDSLVPDTTKAQIEKRDASNQVKNETGGSNSPGGQKSP